MKRIFAFLLSLLLLVQVSYAQPITSISAEIDDIPDVYEQQATLFGVQFEFGNIRIIGNEISGSLFVFGDDVKVNAKVNGNVFVFGRDIEFGENFSTTSSLFVFGNKVSISDVKVANEIFAFGNNLTIDGVTARDVFTFGNKININNSTIRSCASAGIKTVFNSTATGNVRLEGDNVKIGSDSLIKGFVEVPFGKFAVADGAVHGELKIITPPTLANIKLDDFTKKVLTVGVLIEVTTLLLLWVLTMFYFKRFKKKTLEKTKGKIWSTFGVGLLAMFLMPFAIVLGCVSIILAPLSLLLALLYFAMILVAEAVGYITLGNLVAESDKLSKLGVHNGIWVTLCLAIVTTLLGLAGGVLISMSNVFVSFVGLMLVCVVCFPSLLGFGVLFKYFFVKKKCCCEEKKVTVAELSGK